jgi:hypothetical protein
MLRIYKYTIPVEDEFVLQLPAEAQVLDVQTQHGWPQLWALIDPKASTESRRFILRGTGHDIRHYTTETLKYCGTFQLQSGQLNGQLVFHVFEVR